MALLHSQTQCHRINVIYFTLISQKAQRTKRIQIMAICGNDGERLENQEKLTGLGLVTSTTLHHDSAGNQTQPALSRTSVFFFFFL